MAANLLDTLQGYVTPEMIQHASAFLDERPSSTQKAIEGAVPAFLGGLMERSASPSGADSLMNVINRVGQSVDLGELARGGGSLDDLVRSGQGVLSTVFGSKLSAVTEQIASASGLRQASTSSLLAMLAPVVLGVLGREVSSKGLSASGLVSLLASQRADVTRFLPAGLGGLFGGVTGLASDAGASAASLGAQATGAAESFAGRVRDSASAIGDRVGSAATSASNEVARRAEGVADTIRDTGGAFARGVGGPPSSYVDRDLSSGSVDGPIVPEPRRSRGWLIPALVLALLAFGVWWLLRDRTASERSAQAAETAGAAPSASASPASGSATSPSAPGSGATVGSTPASGSASSSPSGSTPSAGSTPSGDSALGRAGAAVGTAADKAGAAAADAGRGAADAGKAAASNVGSAAAAAGSRAADAGSAAGRGARGVAEKTGHAVAEAGRAVGAGTATAAGATARATEDAAKATARATEDAAKAAARTTGDAAKTTARATEDAAKATARGTEDAAKATARATEDVAKATARGAEDAAKATGHGVGALARKVEHAVAGGGESAPTTTVSLPNGSSVAVVEGSATYDLARYFESGSASDLPRTFVFDRLHFESGSTKLTRQSRQTVNQLATILKAYPSASLRLDGHTDNVGNAGRNKTLSERRAEAVKAMLVSDGVAADHVSTGGHGEEKPIASNDAASGRQQNRRIEVVVTQK